MPVRCEVLPTHKHQIWALLLGFCDPHQLSDASSSGRVVGSDQQVLLSDACMSHWSCISGPSTDLTAHASRCSFRAYQEVAHEERVRGSPHTGHKKHRRRRAPRTDWCRPVQCRASYERQAVCLSLAAAGVHVRHA